MAYTKDTTINGSDTVDRFAHRAEVESKIPPKAGNFDTSSSTHELADALGKLSGCAVGNDLRLENGSGSELASASFRAGRISELFEGANPGLVTAWDNVENFTNSMDKMISDIMKLFTGKLHAFIESTQWHEKDMQQAATTANESAEQILKALQLTFGEIFKNDK